ncbi:hypothetical protein EYF80_024264 [Liparis tanakae]|uniref:Uncharacterized protein n=1 Tax=Liparis tanakae TaxID=230148 RepID=A0A4Z2HJL0_9TELE|nr:hypothetical protein EYF80_024264 [Liparis tanakae]
MSSVWAQTRGAFTPTASPVVGASRSHEERTDRGVVTDMSPGGSSDTNRTMQRSATRANQLSSRPACHRCAEFFMLEEGGDNCFHGDKPQR